MNLYKRLFQAKKLRWEAEGLCIRLDEAWLDHRCDDARIMAVRAKAGARLIRRGRLVWTLEREAFRP